QRKTDPDFGLAELIHFLELEPDPDGFPLRERGAHGIRLSLRHGIVARAKEAIVQDRAVHPFRTRCKDRIRAERVRSDRGGKLPYWPGQVTAERLRATACALCRSRPLLARTCHEKSSSFTPKRPLLVCIDPQWRTASVSGFHTHCQAASLVCFAPRLLEIIVNNTTSVVTSHA